MRVTSVAFYQLGLGLALIAIGVVIGAIVGVPISQFAVDGVNPFIGWSFLQLLAAGFVLRGVSEIVPTWIGIKGVVKFIAQHENNEHKGRSMLAAIGDKHLWGLIMGVIAAGYISLVLVSDLGRAPYTPLQTALVASGVWCAINWLANCLALHHRLTRAVMGVVAWPIMAFGFMVLMAVNFQERLALIVIVCALDYTLQPFWLAAVAAEPDTDETPIGAEPAASLARERDSASQA